MAMPTQVSQVTQVTQATQATQVTQATGCLPHPPLVQFSALPPCPSTLPDYRSQRGHKCAHCCWPEEVCVAHSFKLWSPVHVCMCPCFVFVSGCVCLRFPSFVCIHRLLCVVCMAQ
jgi:hypothetical protein